MQLMRTTYVPKHSRSHADSEYIYHGEPSLSVTNKFTRSLTNKQTYKHSTLYISTDLQVVPVLVHVF